MFVGVCVASTDAPETLTVPFILAVVSTFADKDVVRIIQVKTLVEFFSLYPLELIIIHLLDSNPDLQIYT